MAPAPAGPPTGPVPVAPWSRATDGQHVDHTSHDHAPHDDQPSADRAARPAPSRPPVAQRREPRGDEHPRRRSRSVAVRAATSRPTPTPAPERRARETEPEPVPSPAPAQPPAGRADVKDRLLAVLLDDPAVAVDATIELDACRAQLERLNSAVQHERNVMRDVLRRLAGTGLRPDQLARLAGMPVEELKALLAPASR
ncbi:hypothetical protein BJF78_34020 [Pseudonocardia sp. CNS-139]|nr:hypothetical protein BJF78_34020 [Pseudonocardia sp. CNS-139]